MARQEQKQANNHPERVAWYRDLVEEMTGCVPLVKPTTIPVLMEGWWYQVPFLVATIPAFVSAAGDVHAAMSGYGATEEEALRSLCEEVHAVMWSEQEALAGQAFALAGVS